MWAFSDEISGEAVTTIDKLDMLDIGPSDARLSLKLRSVSLSELASAIQRTEVATLQGVYMCIIPPLSATRKRRLEGIFRFLHKEAGQHERLGAWHKAGRIYIELSRVFKAYGPDNRFFRHALALLTYTFEITLNITEELSHENLYQHNEHISEYTSKVYREIHSLDVGVLDNFAKLYQMQKRTNMYFPLARRLRGPLNESDEHLITAHEYFNHDPLFAQIMRRRHGRVSDFDEFTLQQAGGGVVSDARAQDVLGWTPLHYVAALITDADSSFYVAKLLGWGADPNATDIAGRSPLHYTTVHGNYSAFQSLLEEEGINVDSCGRDGASPLHCAVKAGHRDMVAMLLQAGANPHVQDSLRKTPLHFAAQHGNLDIIGLLIEKGGNTDAQDYLGRTPAHIAAIYGYEDMVQLYSTADVLVKDNTGSMLLHHATKSRLENVVRLILGKFAPKISHCNESREKPPDDDSSEGAVEIIPNPTNTSYMCCDARGEEEQTALHMAASGPGVEIAQMLLDNKANPNLRDCRGYTPLHCAAASGDPRVIEMLLQHNADPKVLNNDGQKPLDLAREYRRTEVFPFLERVLSS